MAELVALSEAVRELVDDGDVVALEGFTHLIPYAAGHELIRQGRRDLTLIRMTPDLLYDQIIGMGMARKLIFSWGGYPGTDLVGINSRIKFVECPFTGEQLACIPALLPDVAIIHAQKADREGNV